MYVYRSEQPLVDVVRVRYETGIYDVPESADHLRALAAEIESMDPMDFRGFFIDGVGRDYVVAVFYRTQPESEEVEKLIRNGRSSGFSSDEWFQAQFDSIIDQDTRGKSEAA